MHGVYLGGVSLGVEAGVSALIVGLQPLLTAALAGAVLAERVAPRQWAGLGLGLLGVALVLGRKLGQGLKSWMGSTRFLTRTLERVWTEVSLYVLGCNVKRVIAILGAGPLVQAIRA